MAGDSHGGGFAEKMFTVGLAVLLIGGGVALGVSVLGNKLERWGVVDVKYVEPPAAPREKFVGVTPPSGPSSQASSVLQSAPVPAPQVTQRKNSDGSVTTTRVSPNPLCTADPAKGESIVWHADNSCTVIRPVRR